MARLYSEHGMRTALGGVLAAGALVFLWLASIAPSGRLGLAAVAGLFPMMAAAAVGARLGLLCWAAVGLLGLLLLPDKGVALLFLTFFGLYPILKGVIESMRRLPLEWVLKLVFFNLVLTISWSFFRELFLPDPPEWLRDGGLLLYALGNGVFVVYDVGLSRLVAVLRRRIGAGGGRR